MPFKNISQVETFYGSKFWSSNYSKISVIFNSLPIVAIVVAQWTFWSEKAMALWPFAPEK